MTVHSIMVTGANGFVGQALCAAIWERDMPLLLVTGTNKPAIFGTTIFKKIQPSTDWHTDLKNVDAVVHLAARVHMVHDPSPDPLRDYRLVNVDATLNLATQCAAAGVRRFVYLSSIKVNGEATTDLLFSESNIPAPSDPYGISKHEAEVALRRLGQETGMEIVIIRPPLVYGPRVKANFLRLMRWVRRGIPLPLASVDNRRSMIYVGNLVDVILRCLAHNDAAGRTFVVSDGHDVSIPELIRVLASAMGRRPMLLPMPPAALRLAASLAGRGAAAERLLNSLQVDIEYTRKTLEWNPPYSFEAGIEETVRYFLDADRVS